MKKNNLLRYLFPAVAALALGLLLLIDHPHGVKAAQVTLFSFKEMLLVIPPIFVLLGLLDVWVPREKMVRFMGDKSGLLGILLAVFIGSAAAGPLYGAFPVAAVFMRKGVKFTNLLIFLGAWSTTKIPMFLFELSALGTGFAVTRMLANIPGIIGMAYALRLLLRDEEVNALYARAADMADL
jgi:uncharacterized membrane protein YraQ (UPF0718 family)